MVETVSVSSTGNGLRLEHGRVRLGLDTTVEGAVTLLSHAHTDHLDLEEGTRVLTTAATVDVMKARSVDLELEIETVECGRTVALDGCTVTALNAGHVLGSVMFLIEFDSGRSVLFTGDFNVVDSIVHQAAIPVSADVLVTEATYGTPSHVFPPRTLTHRRIVELARSAVEQERVMLLRAYSLGKAQETIALLRSAGIPVVSGNHVIDSVCEVYRRHGVPLEFLSLEDDSVGDVLARGCGLVSSSPKNTYHNLVGALGEQNAEQIWERTDRYELTGWNDDSSTIPLSGHADFPGLVGFVRGVDPRVVYAFTSNAECFADHLRRIGMNAVAIG